MRFFLILFLAVSFPQTPTGTISGRVTDQDTGDPLMAARIILWNTEFKTLTTEDGSFMLKRVPVGTYELRVSAEEHVPVIYKDITVRSDSVVQLTIGLLKVPPYDPKMKFYRPDSTIDYKIRIYNPEEHQGAAPDSLKRNNEGNS